MHAILIPATTIFHLSAHFAGSLSAHAAGQLSQLSNLASRPAFHLTRHLSPQNLIVAVNGLFLGLMTVVGIVNFDYPGVQVTESTAGGTPIDQVSFHTGKMVGTALRGPVNDPTLVSNLAHFQSIFGPASLSSYLFDSVRLWLDNAGPDAPLFVVRVAGAGATPATASLVRATNAAWTVAPNCTSFTLTFGSQTTSSLTVSGLTAAAVQTALVALSSIGAGNVSVTGTTGGPFTVILTGTLADTTQSANALTSTPTGGAALCPVTQTAPGGPVNTIQITTLGPGTNYNYQSNNASWTITPGTATSFTLTYLGQVTSPLTVAGLTATAVQAALAALSTIGAGNVSVTGTTGGPFTVTLQGALSNRPQTNVSLTAQGTGGTLTVALATSGGRPQGVSVTYAQGLLTVFDAGLAREVYQNVSVANLAFAVQQINGQSNLIQVSWLDSANVPDDISTMVGVAGGADGGPVTNVTYIGQNSSKPYSGLYAFSNPSSNAPWADPGFLMVPGITDALTGNALITIAEQTWDLPIIDSSFGDSTSGALAERDQYASDQGFGLFCYGWGQIVDTITGALKWHPRSPIRAAHIARSHSQPGSLANVGAGVSYVLRDVVALETDSAGIQMDDITQGTLNINGIDVARNFSQEGYGIVHWAARTISNNPLYTFLQVRVIFNVIAVSVKRGLKPYVFRAIDGKGKLADEITAQLNQFLFNMWDADILFGDTPGDAFNVVVNTSNLSLLEQGILQISIYAKPAPIAERIAVTQFRVPLSFDFKTGQIDVGTLQLNETA